MGASFFTLQARPPERASSEQQHVVKKARQTSRTKDGKVEEIYGLTGRFAYYFYMYFGYLGLSMVVLYIRGVGLVALILFGMDCCEKLLRMTSNPFLAMTERPG